MKRKVIVFRFCLFVFLNWLIVIENVDSILVSRFRDWDANAVEWDMLAFANSRCEMVHDALFVLAKMKDLYLHVLLSSHNCLFYNLRHTDFVWNVYDAIKLDGIAQIGNPSSIVVDGLC